MAQLTQTTFSTSLKLDEKTSAAQGHVFCSMNLRLADSTLHVPSKQPRAATTN